MKQMFILILQAFNTENLRDKNICHGFNKVKYNSSNKEILLKTNFLESDLVNSCYI